MIGKYNKQELTPNYTFEEAEHLRLHNILTDLFQRATDGEILSEVEKDFICNFLKNAKGDVPPFDVGVTCANYNFKFTYLTYFYDLSGGSKYYRPFGIEIQEINVAEANSALQYLRQEASEWELQLNDKTTTDRLMLEVIKEYEYELKQVQKNCPEFQSSFQFGGRRIYEALKLSTILQSKFIYLTAKEVFETFDSTELTLTLNGRPILVNEFSIVHITNRHFAETVKKYRSGKSFHNENFHPKLLNTQLSTIFQRIENHGGIQNIPTLREIYFRYQNDVYKIYTTDRVNNQENIYLSTFFIVTDTNQLQKLNQYYDVVNVSADLDFFQPK